MQGPRTLCLVNKFTVVFASFQGATSTTARTATFWFSGCPGPTQITPSRRSLQVNGHFITLTSVFGACRFWHGPCPFPSASPCGASFPDRRRCASFILGVCLRWHLCRREVTAFALSLSLRFSLSPCGALCCEHWPLDLARKGFQLIGGFKVSVLRVAGCSLLIGHYLQAACRSWVKVWRGRCSSVSLEYLVVREKKLYIYILKAFSWMWSCHIDSIF